MCRVEAEYRKGMDLVPIFAAPSASAQQVGEEMVRFCPECGSLGDVPAGYQACCPDASHARIVPKRFAEICRDTFRLLVDKVDANPIGNLAAPAPSASPDTVGVILEMREQAREARQSDPDAGIFADHAYADLLDEWANRLERHDGRMSGLVRDYIEGMSVSIDVSTGEHDAGNRYYGFVSEVMDDPGDKHGVTLLVQDDVRPNFKVSASPAALTDERIREIWDAYVDWSDSPRDGIAFARAVLLAASPAALTDEQIREISREYWDTDGFISYQDQISFARAILAMSASREGA